MSVEIWTAEHSLRNNLFHNFDLDVSWLKEKNLRNIFRIVTVLLVDFVSQEGWIFLCYTANS